MITDCHIHSFAKTEAPQTGAYVPPARDIRDYMDEAAPLGVRRAVVVQASVDGTDNSRLVEVLGTDGPVALRGVAMIDADADLQALHAAGIRATRIQDRARLGDSALDQLPELAKRVAEVGWHIELNTEPRSFDRLADMVVDLPEGLRLVLDHMGHVDPAAPAPLFRLLETGRVWTKLSPTRVSTDIGHYGDLSALIATLTDDLATLEGFQDTIDADQDAMLALMQTLVNDGAAIDGFLFGLSKRSWTLT